MERQPRRPTRGGAAREGARQPMGQGGGAGTIARGCARAAAARRGGAGLGLALLGLACSGLLLGGLCPGPGTGTWVSRQVSSHAPPRLAESRLVPGPAAQYGCQVPADLGIGSRRGCGINTNVESAFLRPNHEQGSGCTASYSLATLGIPLALPQS